MKSDRLRIAPRRRAAYILTLAAAVYLAAVPVCRAADKPPLTISIDASRPVAGFKPVDAFGGGVDGLSKGDVARAYQPANIKELAAAPYLRLSYRLRTELGVHVWHWNPEGTWSDPKRKQGYWTSSSTAQKPIKLSHGYSLPRRGNSHDQAGNQGYSRLTDGDETAFWKSNPYLDAHFTGEDNSLHPQWVVIDFDEPADIQMLRIVWGEPYATQFEVQFWDGKPADHLSKMHNGVWRAFPNGRIENGQGGRAALTLTESPVKLQYMRILLKQSSGPGSLPKGDIRDHLGFAIRELYAGVRGEDGDLEDAIGHSKSAKTQTSITTSSTDPWHSARDLDPDLEQPGIDLVLNSPLTKGQPVLMPTGILYDTPDNAAAEIRYLKARGYDVRQIELGEEPDGQNVLPEHYGALYLQFAAAIRGVSPALETGGPGFQSEIDGWDAQADAAGNTSWMKRFLAYLKMHGRMDTFNFFSFEWYPFDHLCHRAADQLAAHPALVQQALKRIEADGIPKDVPWYISEYGYSSFAGRTEVELPAALLNAEIVAKFLTGGVKTAYLYGMEPNVPIREDETCDTWGNLMIMQAGEDGTVKWRLPAYYGAQLMMEEWAGAPGGQHDVFQAAVPMEAGHEVAGFPVRRPDGKWAVMLLNKSDEREHQVRLEFTGLSGGLLEWQGPLEIRQYSPKQYAWYVAGSAGHPVRSEPPEALRLEAGTPAVITLPPMSLTVVRGPEPCSGAKICSR
jgi:hypothetical protein